MPRPIVRRRSTGSRSSPTVIGQCWRRRLERREERVDVGDPLALLPDPRRRDAHHPEARPRGCGRSAPCRRSWRGRDRARCVGQQSTMRPSATRSLSARTCAPKQPSHVVVLAVDVGGDHAAQRHELRARRDRREPAARQEQPVDARRSDGPPRRAGRRSPRRTTRMRSARRVDDDLVGPGRPAATNRRTSGRARATAGGRQRCGPGPPSAPRARDDRGAAPAGQRFAFATEHVANLSGRGAAQIPRASGRFALAKRCEPRPSERRGSGRRSFSTSVVRPIPSSFAASFLLNCVRVKAARMYASSSWRSIVGEIDGQVDRHGHQGAGCSLGVGSGSTTG